jgi:hypothetical protein
MDDRVSCSLVSRLQSKLFMPFAIYTFFKDLSKAWNSFADWSRDLNVRVAEIDVTENPGLSGRFLVTALPTIYQ